MSNTIPISLFDEKEHWEHVLNALGICSEFLIWQVASKVLCITDCFIY